MLFDKLDYEIHSINKYSTFDWKLYLKKDNKLVSILNDIPLKNKDGTFNMICEIPRYTRQKMEINYKEEYSPIKQDINPKNLILFIFSLNKKYEIKNIKIGEEV